MRHDVKRTLEAFALSAALICGAAVPAHADTILDFSDVPPGTLVIFSPYTSQGFSLTSTSGGFVFDSSDTGNGGPQAPGNNPFFAGANGLSAFSPATITLTDSGGDPFSLLSIGLARNFAFDPAPTVTFTGTLDGGGTVSQTFSVTTPAGTPMAFQTFAFSGFTDVIAVSWEQPVFSQGLHQFGNIDLSEASPTEVPEPSTLSLLLMAVPAALRRGFRRPPASRPAPPGRSEIT